MGAYSRTGMGRDSDGIKIRKKGKSVEVQGERKKAAEFDGRGKRGQRGPRRASPANMYRSECPVRVRVAIEKKKNWTQWKQT